MSKKVEVDFEIDEDGKMRVLDIHGVAGQECTKVAEALRRQLAAVGCAPGVMERTKNYASTQHQVKVKPSAKVGNG